MEQFTLDVWSARIPSHVTTNRLTALRGLFNNSCHRVLFSSLEEIMVSLGVVSEKHTFVAALCAWHLEFKEVM